VRSVDGKKQVTGEKSKKVGRPSSSNLHDRQDRGEDFSPSKDQKLPFPLKLQGSASTTDILSKAFDNFS
jgi:hypothetical protein